MASKTISITSEVYDLLCKLKLPDENLGDTIKRICNEKLASHLIDWINDKTLWSDMDTEEYQEFQTSLKSMVYTLNEVNIS